MIRTVQTRWESDINNGSRGKKPCTLLFPNIWDQLQLGGLSQSELLENYEGNFYPSVKSRDIIHTWKILTHMNFCDIHQNLVRISNSRLWTGCFPKLFAVLNDGMKPIQLHLGAQNKGFGHPMYKQLFGNTEYWCWLSANASILAVIPFCPVRLIFFKY